MSRSGVVGAVVMVALGAVGAPSARAQEVALEVRPFAGAVSLSFPKDRARQVGLALGGGIEFFDGTLHPDTDGERFHDLEQLLHANAFVRYRPGSALELDLGLRAGFGGVRECDASDCWPGVYTGLYAGAAVGSRRVRIGTRLLAAAVRERGATEPVLYIEFPTLRIRLR